MARNYVKVRGLKWQFNNVPLPAITGDLAAWGANDADLIAQRDRVNLLFLTANPPDTDWFFTYPNDPITAFILYDKPSVLSALNWQGNGLYFYANSVGLPVDGNQTWPMLVNPDKSPRYTGWKDPAGEVHKPPPTDKKGSKSDFSGAAGLVQAFLALEAYALVLKQSGRARDAGIVQFAIDQVNKNVWSITEAFDYLRKNGLL